MDEYEEYFSKDNVNSVFIRNTINVNFEGQKWNLTPTNLIVLRRG